MHDIKLSNEMEIRHAAEEKTAREFKRQRDLVEAEYRAQIRFVHGEGVIDTQSQVTFVGVETPTISLVSERNLNSDSSRLERLRQEELSKVGESTYQRFAKFIPVVGSAIDYSYDRISGTEFVGSLGIDAASILALVGMQKAVAGSKAALQAKFARNLNARFNQAPYNPRAMERMIIEQYAECEVTSKTMPRANAKNVKLANGGKIVTIGVDEITGEQITKHIPFNARGLPVFDDICVCDLRLPENVAKVKNRDFHFKHATLELKNLIEAGHIDGTIFSHK